MRDRIIFLSDIHLGVEPPGSVPNRLDALLRLMRIWEEQASHLVLVGDIFEFWWESRHYIPQLAVPFAAALQTLVNAGVEVHYLGGNHDFAPRRYFSEKIGVHVHARQAMLALQGKRVLLRHGDGLAKKDGSYRFARALIDSSLCRMLYGLLPLDWAMGLAIKVGSGSRWAGKDRPIPHQDYAQAAQKLLREFNADIFVQGHTHAPFVENYPEGVHANAGMWLFRCTYLEMQGGNLRVVEVF